MRFAARFALMPRLSCLGLSRFTTGGDVEDQFKSEIQRVKDLRARAITAAGLEPPANEIFDKPDNGLGHGVAKLHRQLFAEI